MLAFALVAKKPAEKPMDKPLEPQPAAKANPAPVTAPATDTTATSAVPPAQNQADGAKTPADAVPPLPQRQSRILPNRSKTGSQADAKPDAKAAIVLGTINLQIGPWGEVLINGKTVGVSPPIKQHKLPPGKYKVEVRNTTFAPYVATVEVKAKEEVVVRHTFR